MIEIAVYLFWAVFIFLIYLHHTYKHSKNKNLVFRTGVFRPLSYVFAILAVSPILVNFLLPDTYFAIDTEYPVVLDPAFQDTLKREGNWILFYQEAFEAIVQNFNYAGILIAGLILVAWLIYIKRLDFFDQDRPVYIFSTLFAGMFLAFATLIVTDQFRLIFDIRLQDRYLYDLFLYYVVSVGMVEEMMKLLPFFIILFFSKEIKEPYDYILYACTSAMGFAFIENLVYFQSIEINVVAGRALMAVAAHMIFSTFCVYGIIISRYKLKRRNWTVLFILYFLFASFGHGFYDFLATNDMVPPLLVLFIIGLQAWSIMINNAINNSKFFDYGVIYNAERSKLYLAVLLTTVITLGYIADALKYGKTEANAMFLYSCLTSVIFIVFYTTSFSSLDLVKGYWRPVKFRFKPDYDEVPGFRAAKAAAGILKYNFIMPLNIVHYKIWLKPPHYNRGLYEQMYDTRGIIIDRVKLYDNEKDHHKVDVDWFLVRLESPLLFEGFDHSHVLIKLENKEHSLIHDADVRGYLRLIPDIKYLEEAHPVKKEFDYAGFIYIDAYEYPEQSGLQATHKSKELPARV